MLITDNDNQLVVLRAYVFTIVKKSPFVIAKKHILRGVFHELDDTSAIKKLNDFDKYGVQKHKTTPNKHNATIAGPVYADICKLSDLKYRRFEIAAHVTNTHQISLHPNSVIINQTLKELFRDIGWDSTNNTFSRF